MRPGCADWESEIPGGGRQKVSFLGPISLPEMAEESVAFNARFIVDNAITYGSVLVIRNDERLTTLNVFSDRRPDKRFIRELAILAADSL
jgi:hypothetical protein